jgi:hypothetical protein
MTVLAYERAQMRQGGLQNDSDIRYLFAYPHDARFLRHA